MLLPLLANALTRGQTARDLKTPTHDSDTNSCPMPQWLAVTDLPFHSPRHLRFFEKSTKQAVNCHLTQCHLALPMFDSV